MLSPGLLDLQFQTFLHRFTGRGLQFLFHLHDAGAIADNVMEDPQMFVPRCDQVPTTWIKANLGYNS